MGLAGRATASSIIPSALTASESNRQTLPYGSWPTTITSELVVAQAIRLYDARADGDALVWSEARPAEGGRTALVNHKPEEREEWPHPLVSASGRQTAH